MYEEELEKLNSIIFGDPLEIAEYYIEPDLQDMNPADRHEEDFLTSNTPMKKIINRFFEAEKIFEEGGNITLLADMPGVKPGDLKIDLHDNILTMIGEVDDPGGEAESLVFREYQSGRYHRQFTLSDKVDKSKIEAKLSDGVLRLVLPKAEASKPREIPIKTG